MNLPRSLLVADEECRDRLYKAAEKHHGPKGKQNIPLQKVSWDLYTNKGYPMKVSSHTS